MSQLKRFLSIKLITRDVNPILFNSTFFFVCSGILAPSTLKGLPSYSTLRFFYAVRLLLVPTAICFFFNLFPLLKFSLILCDGVPSVSIDVWCHFCRLATRAVWQASWFQHSIVLPTSIVSLFHIHLLFLFLSCVFSTILVRTRCSIVIKIDRTPSLQYSLTFLAVANQPNILPNIVNCKI